MQQHALPYLPVQVFQEVLPAGVDARRLWHSVAPHWPRSHALQQKWQKGTSVGQWRE
jgi:hypothetical protein